MSIWNKLTLIESTEEEKEITGYEYQWQGPTPELFERVLITTTKSIDEAYIDVWTDFDVGVGFEDTELEIGQPVYWASIPEFDLED